MLPLRLEGTPNVEDGLRILLGFDKPDQNTAAHVLPFIGDGNPGIAAKAFAILLSTEKSEYYAELLEFLKQRGSAIPELVLYPLAARLQNPPRELNPKIMDELSNLNLPVIKLNAMEGMRKLRSTESVSTLIGHLNDADSILRYLAVITLSEIVTRDGYVGPSMYEFDKNPSRYVEDWELWWAQDGKRQYGGK